MIFDTGISGLNAASSHLDVIGNNIANSSTVGFKGSRANFGDIYSFGGYNSGGSTTVGGGVMLTQVQQMFKNGTITNTNNTLDLAISGNGFFILNDQGTTVYTRAGQFGLDNQNYITNSTGQFLTGYLADASGNITGSTGKIQVNQANLAPQASSTVTAGLNLNSGSTPPAADWAGGAAPVSDTYNNTTSMTIYDSLGNSHVLSMYFIKANAAAAAGSPDAASPPGTENQWYVAFQIDNQDVPAIMTPGNSANLYAVNFNSDGSFSLAQDTTGTPLASNLIPLSMTLTNGANPLNLNVDLSNCTQFGSPFAVQSANSNGYTTGNLSGLQVAADGTVSGSYSNGQTLAMGQIQLANFADLEGLQNIGNVCWSATAASGQPLIGIGTTGSFGDIRSGSLEQSNVDLTGELVSLIGAQRDFQANAQTIRTGDAITQTIINMR
ncbi:flagellar hook protein FlgE [Legionella rowbothamii]|uniref:flagellar hook protein FlgE n=1 Tax=Legionella rowbothamii TaxID=96229 RepID=UPI0010558356|nr:flagellar hook protein FlgE [Legionella rowbothamii]